MPPRSGGTAAIAADARTGLTAPTPRPVRARPGSRAAQPEEPSRTPCSSVPRPITASPPASGTATGSAASRRPASAGTAKATTLIGSRVSPAAIGPRPSADCSHSEMYGIPEKAVAE